MVAAILLLASVYSQAQVYVLPMDRISQIRQDRAGIGVQPGVHQSAKPILRNSVNVEGIDGLAPDTADYYFKVVEKIFSEHLVELEKKDLKVHGDFIFDFGFGSETVDDISSTGANTDLFQNTRGFRFEGQVGKSVYFFTDFRENQGRYPAYLNAFIDSLGVMPGSGRVKDFKSGAYDYSMVGGFVGIEAAPWLDLSFGHSKQFIGNGYRSLLLSDNAHNYPFASYNTKFFKGKLQYRYSLALLQDLERLPQGETPEAIFKRKTSSWNYLTYKPLPNLEIGLFEQVIWKIYDDSLGSRPFDYRALIPVPGLNSAILGLEDPENNAFLGLNLAWHPWKTIRVYGQVVVDDNDFVASGYQVGALWSGIFDRIDIQLEFNRLEEGVGRSEDPLQSADHFNQPLAHVLGSGFEEWVGMVTYYKNRIFARAKGIFYNRERVDEIPANSITSTVFNGDLRFGYIFNPSCNLEIYSGYNYRSETVQSRERINGFWYLGIRTNLSNVYTDF